MVHLALGPERGVRLVAYQARVDGAKNRKPKHIYIHNNDVPAGLDANAAHHYLFVLWLLSDRRDMYIALMQRQGYQWNGNGQVTAPSGTRYRDTCSRTGELSFVSPLPPSFVFTEPGADRARYHLRPNSPVPGEVPFLLFCCGLS